MLDLEIEVLFEISLSVGVTLSLDEAVQEFLAKNVKSLNRVAGAIVRHEDSVAAGAAVMASIPDTFARDAEVSRVLKASRGDMASALPPRYHERAAAAHGNLAYDVFSIPGLGSLVLYGKPLQVSSNFYQYFDQILKKFAASCQACVLRSDNEQQARRLGLATKAARIGTWEMDLASGILVVDDRIQTIFGLHDTGNHFTLDEFYDFVYAEDKSYVAQHLQNYVAQGINEPTEYSFRILRSDGDIRKLAAHALLLFENERPVKLVGVNYDVTEIELARTQSLYRSELESLLVSLSVDLIKNRYEALDEVINSALGRAGEFVGADRAYRFEYDFEKETTSNTHEWCAPGIEPAIADLQDLSIHEIPLWVTAHRAGLPFYVNSVRELPSGHGLRIILEPQGIQSLITIPLINDDLCVGFIGFDAVKAERLWTEVDVTLLRLLADLLVNADVRIQHEALINEQHLALTTARDNAEVLAHEASQASDAKSRFVARVSHEIRTPLHAILGLTDLVLEEEPTAYIHELATTIRESGSILLDLINDVLDYSKAESKDVVLNEADFELAELFTMLESMFRPLARKKSLKFSIALAADLPRTIVGDRLRIRQIITNLLSNAMKFTAAGAVTVTVDLLGGIGEWLVVSVADTGTGIPPDDIEQLFQPFFQSSNTHSLALTGTGLGLTISRALAERMGGRIEVESSLGAGSRFTLTIPLVRGEQASVVPVLPTPSAAMRYPPDLCILVAEDNPINVQLIKAYLKDMPGELVCVSDGQQAYEAYLQRPEDFHMVLMDCNMPELDGYAATRSIRASEGGLRRTPIVAVTAGALEEERDDALAAGMDEVLIKPFSKSDLLALIARFVSVDPG